MFTSPLVLTPSAGITGASSTAINFDRASQSMEKSVFRVETASLDAPHLLTISHQATRSGSSIVDRHLVRVDLTEPADGDIPEGVISAYLVLAVPRASSTSAEVINVLGALIDFVNDSANVTKLLNNVT